MIQLGEAGGVSQMTHFFEPEPIEMLLFQPQSLSREICTTILLLYEVGEISVQIDIGFLYDENLQLQEQYTITE